MVDFENLVYTMKVDNSFIFGIVKDYLFNHIPNIPMDIKCEKMVMQTKTKVCIDEILYDLSPKMIIDITKNLADVEKSVETTIYLDNDDLIKILNEFFLDKNMEVVAIKGDLECLVTDGVVGGFYYLVIKDIIKKKEENPHALLLTPEPKKD